MEKIRHDSSYEWLSGESWKEWSASFFSMGWKIWGRGVNHRIVFVSVF